MNLNHKRHKRLRLLFSKLNKQRKVQAKKIDILCNDFIAAQRNFIKNLATIVFTANFYESILGTTDLNSLFYTAGKLIKDQIPDANIAFILRQSNSFDLHVVESDHPITLEQPRLEECFTPELVETICKSNKLCKLDSLLEMGLQINPTMLSKISAITIPLGQFGSCPGFILIYRPCQNQLNQADLDNIAAVTRGLSKAIRSCMALCHSND